MSVNKEGSKILSFLPDYLVLLVSLRLKTSYKTEIKFEDRVNNTVSNNENGLSDPVIKKKIFLIISPYGKW